MTHLTIKISPDPKSNYSPFHTLLLSPGNWTVKPIDSENRDPIAWNAWSGKVTDCNTPSTCSRGWLHNFQIWSPAFPAADNHMITVGSGRHETPELALKAAPSTIFSLSDPAIVTFFINDSYHDDVGGLTLELSQLK